MRNSKRISTVGAVTETLPLIPREAPRARLEAAAR